MVPLGTTGGGAGGATVGGACFVTPIPPQAGADPADLTGGEAATCGAGAEREKEKVSAQQTVIIAL